VKDEKSFRVFEYHLGLMEKQIRMLSEIADAAPMVQPEGYGLQGQLA